jgi:hypothetical protein
MPAAIAAVTAADVPRNCRRVWMKGPVAMSGLLEGGLGPVPAVHAGIGYEWRYIYQNVGVISSI